MHGYPYNLPSEQKKRTFPNCYYYEYLFPIGGRHLNVNLLIKPPTDQMFGSLGIYG